MSPMIPAPSMWGMVFSLAVAIVLPVAALVYFRKKTGGSLLCALIGAGVFVVFALVLEPMLHRFMQSTFGDRLTGNILLYALYGGLAAGVFEETGRFLGMKFLMRKNLTRENSLLYGIGHGGAESVILVGMTFISNLAVSIMINAGMLEKVLEGLDEPLRAQAMEQISVLWTAPASQFFLAGIERAAAFTLQICLSYIVYRAVKDGKLSLWLLAVAIHFAVDAAIVLLARVLSPYVVESILVAVVICLAVFIARLYRSEAAASAE